jgi:nucleotide-binding universal stress UspA family protein
MAKLGASSPLRVILAATDFSAPARRALTRAALLAQAHRAKLVIFNVLNVPAEALETMGARPSELARHFRAQLEREAVRASPGPGLRRGETDFRFGRPFVEIVRAARDWGAGLIVLGAHGERGVRGPLLGTTAEKVIRKSELPVLVVKRPARREYARVLVAVDFSALSRKALELAMRIAPDARLHLLHACGYPPELRLGVLGLGAIPGPASPEAREGTLERARAAMDEFLGGIDLQGRDPRLHLEEGSPERLVPAAARTVRPGLLVVGSHGRTGLTHALLGSVAEQAVREAPCDVLVARAGRAEFRLP